jgi:ABC-type polysaccharide/polyol phosphate export permease
MSDQPSLTEPLPEWRYHRPVGAIDAVREVWGARRFIRALAEREVRAQYKQATLGVLWVLVTPLILVLIFTLLFQRVADVDTGGVPYLLFSYIALVPWQFFSSSVSSGGTSIISSVNLVNKIRCPREVFPLSSIATSGINAVIAAGILIVFFLIEGFWPKPTSFLMVIPLAVHLAFTAAVVLTMAGITVFLRDVRHGLPIFLQLALFATPVGYSLDEFVPEQWQTLYVIVNPLGATLTSFREVVLFGNGLPWDLLGPATVATALYLYGSIRLFRRLQIGFADVA